jgi:class 3 adenylate cyclase
MGVLLNAVHPVHGIAEDHLAGHRLKHARHHNADGLADALLPALHHHHGAVVQVGDALLRLFPLPNDADHQFLAGQHHRLHRVRQLVTLST